jgi:hypothetical protein
MVGAADILKLLQNVTLNAVASFHQNENTRRNTLLQKH